jgi:hypothetical protein
MDNLARSGSVSSVVCCISVGFSAPGQCFRLSGMPLYLCTFSLSIGSELCVISANPCLLDFAPVSSVQQGLLLFYVWWQCSVSSRVDAFTL